MEEIKGTGVALVTPFSDDLSIDYDSLEKLIDYVIDGGVDYLVLMGTTGESPTISKEEKIEIIDFCQSINKGRLPIVLGIGGNNTMQVIADIESSNLEGIDAILSVSPAYNKPTQEGIYQHYKMISRSTSLPIILYNVPGRTSANMLASTTIRLANEFDNIVAIKEASGDLDQIANILDNKPDSFMVLSGDDNLTLDMINIGAQGVISVIGQSHPKDYSTMVSLALEGKKELANKIHLKLYDYYDPLYAEGNPVGIKACLDLLAICKPFVRLPLVEASGIVRSKLSNLLSL